jgi:hypothetical protein
VDRLPPGERGPANAPRADYRLLAAFQQRHHLVESLYGGGQVGVHVAREVR